MEINQIYERKTFISEVTANYFDGAICGDGFPPAAVTPRFRANKTITEKTAFAFLFTLNGI